MNFSRTVQTHSSTKLRPYYPSSPPNLKKIKHPTNSPIDQSSPPYYLKINHSLGRKKKKEDRCNSSPLQTASPAGISRGRKDAARNPSLTATKSRRASINCRSRKINRPSFSGPAPEWKLSRAAPRARREIRVRET